MPPAAGSAPAPLPLGGMEKINSPAYYSYIVERRSDRACDLDYAPNNARNGLNHTCRPDVTMNINYWRGRSADALPRHILTKSSAVDRGIRGMTIRLNPTGRWKPRLRDRSSNAPLRRLKRLTLAAILVCAVLSIATSVALSQGAEGTPEQREACTLDAVNLCGTVIPDARRVEGCLLQHIAIVSLRCRAVIEKGRRSDRTSVSGSPRKSN
jgi:hypothetical protein